MISVLVGFFTIFIGVFMVNDAKASNTSFIERQGSQHRNSYQMETGYKGPVGEFLPLKDLDESQELSNDEEFTGQSKYQR
jgi:hypothetical protein